MKLNVAQVLGLNTDQKAAQVTSLIRDGDDAFFAVLELVSDDAFTKGRLALSELSDFYFEAEGTPSEKLHATYEEAKKKFEGAEFDILVASISGKVLYFIGHGNVEVFLKRAEKVSSLLPIGAPSQLVSGFLQEGDRIFFATKNLTDVLADDLNKSLNLPMDAFEEDLTDRIGAVNSEGNGLAGLLVEVEKEIESVAIDSLGEQVDPKPVITGEETSKFSRFLLTKILEKTFFLLTRLASLIPKSGRGKLIIAAILLIFLAAGLGLRFKSVKDEQKQTLFNQTIQQARDDFNAAKGLTTLNPVEAKARLDSAKDKIDKALSLKPKDEEAKNLKAQIEENAASILQQSKVSEFPIFLDLNLVKEKFNATRMSLSTGKILLLDPIVKTLVVVDLVKKSNQILAGTEQLGDASFASLNGGVGFIYSKDKGVLRIDTTNQKLTTVSQKDKDWADIKDLYGFAGNIYLVDGGNPPAGPGQIWKYLPTADGYSDKREYLSKGIKVDFNNSLRVQIESSIYVLKSGGEILRFTRGDKDNFSLGGLDKGVKDPKSIFVSSDTDNFYLLDSGNSRLLILTKTGSYKGQIEGEKFATSTDLVVDEVGKKVYLLEGSKIYSVDLK